MDTLWRTDDREAELLDEKRRKRSDASDGSAKEMCVSPVHGPPRAMLPWHLTHRPSRDKPRKKLTMHHDIAQIGFGGCGGMYNYFLGVASVLQVRCVDLAGGFQRGPDSSVCA
jgi:hypothetical protein